MPPLRIAVIGAGMFGRNHLRVLREIQQVEPGLVELVAVVDPSLAARESATLGSPVLAYSSIAELLRVHPGLDAATIAVPTTSHAELGMELLRAGLDLLIEKPFASSLAEADAVIALAANLNRIVAIGHLERFNPAVVAAAARITRPMFFEAHRLSIFTPRALDVDVVLDLMIHDLDIVLSLVKSPVSEVRAVGFPVLSRKVDIANVRVEFHSGCVANFTASRVSTETVRKLRLFQPRQYLSLDFARQELLCVEVSEENQRTMAAASRPAAQGVLIKQASPHPSTGLELGIVPLEKAEPLRLELEDFLHAVRTRKSPRVSGEDGRVALSLGLRISEAIAAHSQRAGLT